MGLKRKILSLLRNKKAKSYKIAFQKPDGVHYLELSEKEALQYIEVSILNMKVEYLVLIFSSPDIYLLPKNKLLNYIEKISTSFNASFRNKMVDFLVSNPLFCNFSNSKK